MRFIASDENDGSLIEAAVDDFVLMALYPVTAVGDEPGDMVVRYVTGLNQNSPNPFNPRTEIKFSLRQAGPAQLQIFDMRGRMVKKLVSGDLPAGEHQVTWNGDTQDGRPVATGVYFYRLETDNTVLTKRMLLVK